MNKMSQNSENVKNPKLVAALQEMLKHDDFIKPATRTATAIPAGLSAGTLWGPSLAIRLSPRAGAAIWNAMS